MTQIELLKWIAACAQDLNYEIQTRGDGPLGVAMIDPEKERIGLFSADVPDDVLEDWDGPSASIMMTDDTILSRLNSGLSV